MKYRDPTKVVAFSAADHKHAALFFERIIPLHSAGSVPAEVTWPFWENATKFDSTTDLDSMKRLFETRPDDCELPRRLKSAFAPLPQGNELSAAIDELLELGGVVPRESTMEAPESVEELCSRLTTITRRIDLGAHIETFWAELRNGLALLYAMKKPIRDVYFVPVVGESKKVKFILPEGKDDSVSWMLSNLRLVNTERAEWKQIIAIRRDEVEKRQLRNLLLFIADDFSGKSEAYVRDAIERKIEDYECACRKHGFGMIVASITAMLDSRSFLGLAAVAVAGILTEQNTLAGTAAGVAAVFETSRTALSVIKRKNDLSGLKRDHELAYVFGARQKLEKGKGDDSN